MTVPTPQPSRDVVASLLADTSPYLSCDECFDRLDEYVEQLLAHGTPVDQAMATHLRGCAACGDEAEALLSLVVGERS